MNVIKNPIKEAYGNIIIPPRLDDAVKRAIKEGTTQKKYHLKKIIKNVLTAAASFFIMLIITLNLSSSFAAAMFNIPVIGEICRLFTFSEYSKTDGIKKIEVKIPNIEFTGNMELEHRINLEIAKIIDDEADEAAVRAEEYYDAYISTGGKPDEYRPIKIKIDYELKYSDEKIVSFMIYKSETLANAYQTSHYYNIDLESGRNLTLRDIFGNGYKQTVTDRILHEIGKLDEEKKFYLFDDINIADLIDENRKFYIAPDGRSVVIVFEKYEIAAGAAGQLEFTIGRLSGN